MPYSINKVQLIGNLGKDPEVRALQNGDRIANLSVATSEQWKDRGTGEKRERTEWHRVVVWEQHAVDFCDKYLRKGDKVYIEGKIETRKWTDQQGQDRYSTEIQCKQYGGTVMSLGGPNGGGDQQTSRGGGNGGTGRLRDEAQSGGRGGYGGGGDGSGYEQPRGSLHDDLNDEIPFASSAISDEPSLAKMRRPIV